ncbi:Sodium channel and clathrin linker 1 [Trichoplax sp. H2]|nr:Sodium channel and clathrin linker 1 [Trichoplax sp. H2]|eukprot:RDD42507.1 Sodium channel and clathrin linker 1 [Trichoplax sp. H2]
MASDADRLFLEDQVRRLNTALARYRAKYPPLSDDEQLAQKLDPTLLQLSTDRSLMAPLLQEYEDTITLLKSEIQFYKSQVDSFKDRTGELVSENKKLYTELKQITLNAGEMKASTYSPPILPVDTAKGDLHERFQALSQEKDRYVELWQLQSRDLKSIRQQFEEQSQELQKKALELIATQEQLDEIVRGMEETKQENRRLKSEYQKSSHHNKLQTEELETLQNELRKGKAEMRTLQANKQEMRRLLDNVSDRMKEKEKQVEGASYRDKTMESQIQDMQRKLVEMDARFKTSVGEVKRLQLERGELEERLALIQKKGADYEQREYEAVKRVRDSIQLVENAMLERDQALINEQQKNLEAMRLQEEISKLMNQNQDKTRDEVEATRKHYNRTINKLSEDIQSAEFELDERKLEIEKLQREKRLLEQELLKANSAETREDVRSYNQIEQYQSRACIAERARDEALLKVDQLQSVLRSMDSSYRDDKNHLLTQNEELKQRLKQLQNECETISENRLKILSQVDSLQREVRISEQKQMTGEQKYLKEISTLENKIQLREREFQAQLKNSENVSWQSSQEIRTLLLSQQRATTKWREESKGMASKYEAHVNQSRNEVHKLKQQNEELITSSRLAKDAIEKLTRKLKDSQASENRLKRSLQETEEQMKESSQKLSSLLSRERQILDERKLLLKEIDKLRLESGRSFRDQSIRRFGGESSNLFNTTGGNIQSSAPLRNYSGMANPTILTDKPLNSQTKPSTVKPQVVKKIKSSRSSSRSQLLDDGSSRASSEGYNRLSDYL